MIPIGVVVPPDLPAGEFIGYAQEAERRGFDQLWVVEDSGVTDLVQTPAGDAPRTRLAELARVLPELRRSGPDRRSHAYVQGNSNSSP